MSYTADEKLFRVYLSVFEQEAPELIQMPVFYVATAGKSLSVNLITVQK